MSEFFKHKETVQDQKALEAKMSADMGTLISRQDDIAVAEENLTEDEVVADLNEQLTSLNSLETAAERAQALRALHADIYEKLNAPEFAAERSAALRFLESHPDLAASYEEEYPADDQNPAPGQ